MEKDFCQKLTEELDDLQMDFTYEIAKHLDEKGDHVHAIELWKEKNKSALERYDELLIEIKAGGEFDISKLVVLTKRLSSIVVK